MLSCLCFWNKLHMKRKYLIGRLRSFNRNCLYKSNHSMDFITNLWLQSSNNLKLPLYFSHCNVPVLSAPFCILILKYRIILFFKLRLWMNYIRIFRRSTCSDVTIKQKSILSHYPRIAFSDVLGDVVILV